MIHTTVIDTPLGLVQAAANDSIEGEKPGAYLTGLWFIGQKYFPANAKKWLESPYLPVFVSLNEWLKEYFSGKKPAAKLPLKPQGTPFQLEVWKILLKIPYGRTITYGEITAKIKSAGMKASAQAVGGAVGHNPISIIIPCHRVLGADGSLTGYAGGTEKKLALLELEKGS